VAGKSKRKNHKILKKFSEIRFEEMEWNKPIQNTSPWSLFVRSVTDIPAALKQKILLKICVVCLENFPHPG